MALLFNRYDFRLPLPRRPWRHSGFSAADQGEHFVELWRGRAMTEYENLLWVDLVRLQETVQKSSVGRSASNGH